MWTHAESAMRPMSSTTSWPSCWTTWRISTQAWCRCWRPRSSRNTCPLFAAARPGQWESTFPLAFVYAEIHTIHVGPQVHHTLWQPTQCTAIQMLILYPNTGQRFGVKSIITLRTCESALLTVVIFPYYLLELPSIRDLNDFSIIFEFIFLFVVLLSVFLHKLTTLSLLILFHFKEVFTVLKKRNNEIDLKIKGDKLVSCTCSLCEFVLRHWNFEMEVFL